MTIPVRTISNWCHALRVRGDWKPDTWADLAMGAKELRGAVANETEVSNEPSVPIAF